MKRIITLSAYFLLMICSNISLAQMWSQQNSATSERLQDVNFYGNYGGYLFGDTLSIVNSTNSAGSSWSNNPMAFLNGDIRSSAITDASTVYAAGVHTVVGGKGLVMKSVNSGVSWTIDTSFVEDLFDVHFTSLSIGYISGENGYMAKTTNGGNSWLDLNTGTEEDLFSIDFVSNTEGWAVGTVDANAVIIRTNDGGITWTAQTSGLLESLFAVDFTDNLNGWAVGANGTIINTNDGGATWSIQSSGVNQDLFDLHMLDLNNGWAVGAGGTILKTTDSGTNWIQEASGTTTDILSIHMRSTTLGWICGDGGEVHVYAIDPQSVGIGENNFEHELVVFPNPTNNILNIQFDTNLWNYNLIDVNGRIVNQEYFISEGIRTIDVSKLNQGMYLLILESNDVQYVRRVIIE